MRFTAHAHNRFGIVVMARQVLIVSRGLIGIVGAVMIESGKLVLRDCNALRKRMLLGDMKKNKRLLVVAGSELRKS